MRHETTETKKRKLSPLLIAATVLLLLALALFAAVVGIWLSGRNAMTQSNTAPTLPTIETPTESTPADNGDYIHYNGKRYEYNQNMINILLLGIDSMEAPGQSTIAQDQADVIILAALDQRNRKMTLINLPRDAMCDIELFNSENNRSTLLNTQLCMSYALKDDPAASCELTASTVSNLFFGLPIQGYGAYYIGGIVELNDAVGGVTLTVIGDFDISEAEYWLHDLKAGNVVTLNRHTVRKYVQHRDTSTVDGNELRMQRQKQYMLGLLSRAKAMFMENPASVLTLYDAVDEYLVTDLSINEISYLATIAASLEFAEDIRSLSGEYRLNEETHSAELYIDQQELQALMIDVFYTEVP